MYAYSYAGSDFVRVNTSPVITDNETELFSECQRLLSTAITKIHSLRILEIKSDTGELMGTTSEAQNAFRKECAAMPEEDFLQFVRGRQVCEKEDTPRGKEVHGVSCVQEEDADAYYF
jgi:hypothetical protein